MTLRLDRSSSLIRKQTASRETLFQFGYEISYLPDFLQESSVFGENLQQQLEDVFLKFQNFVLGLHKYKSSSYALRFIALPETRTVRMALLGALRVGSNAEGLAQRAMEDLGVHLANNRFPVKRLDAGGLAWFLNPFPEEDLHLFEIRQKERDVELSSVNSSAYVIYPFQGPQGTLMDTFQLMTRLNVPVVLNILIQPTEVRPEERALMEKAAFLAQTYSEINAPTISDTSVQTRRDPNANLVGRLYEAYLDSLAKPFLAVTQALSPDINAALSVAKSFSTDAVMNKQGLETAHQRPLPTDTELVTPENNQEQAQALVAFHDMLVVFWGQTLARPGRERLRFLMGASAAATLFRFPINITSGLPGIPVRQTPPEFHPGPIQSVGREISLGAFSFGDLVPFPVNNLVRHAFVTGFTGSGKTNTMLTLLDQVWREHQIPFLVIESAKKEYRALLNDPRYQDLLVFTFGDETTSPFRFNPFELLPGIRLEAHLGRLQACFDAALPQFGILPSIIAEALEKVYQDQGWALTDIATENEERPFPTMKTMFRAVIQVSERRGYRGELAHNIRAAAAGRIGSLLRGSRGRMMDVQKSISPDLIFKRPVIFELNDLNQQDKSLTLMFLLMWLREYREQRQTKQLSHVTVIEEAHNVLSTSGTSVNPEIAPNTRGASVEAFTNLITEIRSYGEGLFIVDQSPSKIATDAIRNTNLQIAHQLRDEQDRNVIARAMIMDDHQKNYLAKLGVGKAALFFTGLEKATFVTVPDIRNVLDLGSAPPSDQDVRAHMAPLQKQIVRRYLAFGGCQHCRNVCAYRDRMEPFTMRPYYHQKMIAALSLFNEKSQRAYWPAHWREIAGVSLEAAEAAGAADPAEAGFCFLAQTVDFPFTEHMRTSYDWAVSELKGKAG